MRNILNKPVDTKLALALYVLVLVLGTIIIGITSCRSSKEIAAENERRRQEHIALLEEIREKHPCDTFRAYSIDTLLQYVAGDTVRIGERVFVHDTAFIKRTVIKFVLDSAWLQQYRDSLESANYLFDLARHDANIQASRADKAEASAKSAKEDMVFYRRIVFIGSIALGLFIGGFGALKIFGKI